jgi:hypothetical protein
LEGEVVVLEYRCPFGLSAAESIYLLDQELAKFHLRYYAELRGSRWFPVFDLYFPAEHLESVRRVIAQLRNGKA